MKLCPLLMATSALLLTAGVVQAQPSTPMAFELSSGSVSNGATDFTSMVVGRVEVAGAPWLRIHVADYDLGERSYVRFTSLQDGGWQQLTSRTLPQWQNWSAFFNGDAVEVELFVAPGERGIFLDVDEIRVGTRLSGLSEILETDPVEEGGGILSLCGDDDRVNSTARRIGRFVNNSNGSPDAKCTAWIIANGAILTAGHCESSARAFAVLEFTTRKSLCDGTVQFSQNPNADQYPVDVSTIDAEDNGIGADWMVLGCFANGNGLLPALGQNAFARVARDLDPDDVRVAGYGQDRTPEGCNDDLNSDNRTLQKNSGAFRGESNTNNGVKIEHRADTETGNSGSPIVDTATDVAIGIHTNGGCSPPWDSNKGTSFNYGAVQFGINSFPGPNAVYVDKNHPVNQQTGKLFRPFLSIGRALSEGVPAGGILSIVEGTYDEAVTLDTEMSLQTPVGAVVIGE